MWRQWRDRCSPTNARKWALQHRWAIVTAVVVLAVGAVQRAWVLSTPLGSPDLDESAVGVQARWFLDGRVSVFFLGQAYGGTLETGILASAFALFGSSVIVLKLVPMGLALVAAHLARLSAVELGLHRTGQWAVPALVWCGPAFAVWQSTKSRGFYAVGLVLAAACILLGLRLAREVTRRDLVLFGLVIGLGWWQTPLSVLVAVPTALWLVARRPAVVRQVGWSVGAALVGAAPWVVWNLRNDADAMRTTATFGTTWWDRLVEWTERLQVVMGVETPFDEGRRLVEWRGLGLVLLCVALAVATWRTRRAAPGFLLAVIVGYALIYPFNGLAAGVGPDPRYVYFLTVPVALVVGTLVPDRPTDAQRAGVVALVALLAAGTTAWGLVGMEDEAQDPASSRFLASQGIEEIAALLDEREVEGVVSDTGGMQVAFLTDERVIGTSFASPRSSAFEAQGRVVDPSVYLLEAEHLGNADRLVAFLDRRGIGYDDRRIGRWRVVFIDERVDPVEAGMLVFGGPLQPGEP